MSKINKLLALAESLEQSAGDNWDVKKPDASGLVAQFVDTLLGQGFDVSEIKAAFESALSDATPEVEGEWGEGDERDILQANETIQRMLRLAYAVSGEGRDLGYGEGEGRHTKQQLAHVAEYATELHNILQDDDDLPEWVQSKVSVMSNDIDKIKHYLEYKINRE